MRPVVLAFLRHYLPGYKSGGPVRTLTNMVEGLGEEFLFRIVTSDRDMLDQSPYPDVERDTWTEVGNALVWYASPEAQGLRSWRRLMKQTPHDVVYLNSLFDPLYSQLPLLAHRRLGRGAGPLVIAPRGELSPGAFALKKWKKRPFVAMSNLVRMHRHVVWHASTDDEVTFIRGQFGAQANCLIARNLPARVPPLAPAESARDPSAPLRVVFLSRISPKKNLDYALRVVQQCSIPLQFDIWGTLEDEAYWAECTAIIEAMPPNIEVAYKGAAVHSEVPEVLSAYDLFLFPTRGENYGHVIAESVSSGTPVLLSDQTPWRGLEAAEVGWALPLEGNEAAYVAAIESADASLRTARPAWRERVHAYAERTLEAPEIKDANRRLFLQAISP